MTTKTVHVAVYDTLADWEIGQLTAYLNSGRYQREPGDHCIATVGLSTEPVTTMGGLRVTPDLTIDELHPADSAMLVLPGSDLWVQGDTLVAFADAAATFLDAGRPVAAICGATWGLAKAGLLDDRPHTSGAAQYLAATGYRGGPHYVDEPVVTDGNLITATPVAPVEFARAVFELLDVYDPAKLDAWYRLQVDRDPSAFAELTGA